MAMREEQGSIGSIADSLTPEQRKLLDVIQRLGTAPPAELSVNTFMLPEDLNEILDSLFGLGLIRSVNITTGDGIALSDLGLRVARLERMKRSG
jgi:hypothetical protein